MRWQYIIITLILISIANAIELGDLEDICPKGSILQVSSAYPHNKEWWCGLKPLNSVDNFNISGNIIFIGNVTFNNNVTGIVNVNNSDYLDGYDSTYFYPYSNPRNYINTSNLTAYNTTAQLYTIFLNITDQRYNETNIINRSFNQSLTDSLYYLKSNPNNYINTSNLTAYNTTAQLYSVFLNITDQRYNESNLINTSFNQSLTDSLYAKPGTCAAGEVVQNTTTSGVECVAVSGGWVGTAESDLDFQSTYNIVNVALINGIDPLTWITSESDPVYSANTYAVDMNQNVGTDDSVSFTSITDGTCTISGGSLSGCTETDTVYSANTYAVDMNQNVGTDDSVSFTSITDGTCTISGGSLSGCTYSESDPVYSANTYAVDMDQNVGSDDTPSFTGLTLPASGGSWSVYVDVDNSLNFLWS